MTDVADEKTLALIKVITRIPMFSGVSGQEASQVLQACEFRQADAGETLCKVREPSDDLSILLSGKLGVYTENNIELATIVPVAPVGEMGLLTGQARSATVRVRDRASLLVLRKASFERLIRQHARIAGRVYRNVIHILDQRIQATDGERLRGEAELHGLRERLEAVRRETEELALGGR